MQGTGGKEKERGGIAPHRGMLWSFGKENGEGEERVEVTNL